jgi:hypothetical protein
MSKARISGKRQTGDNKNADEATDDGHLLVFQVVVGKQSSQSATFWSRFMPRPELLKSGVESA